MVERKKDIKEKYFASSAIDDNITKGLFKSSEASPILDDLFTIPSYYKEPKFQVFLSHFKAHINEGSGYMFIITDKNYYQPGDTISGSIFFELFHECISKDLMIEFIGT